LKQKENKIRENCFCIRELKYFELFIFVDFGSKNNSGFGMIKEKKAGRQ